MTGCDSFLMPQTARDHFVEAIAGEDSNVDLAEACLWISAEANPALDVVIYRDKIRTLAGALSAEVSPTGSVVEKVRQVNRHLFVAHNYHGNRDDYYDPRNSYLDCVLDRRTGIPITLSVLWMTVAEKVGLDVYGVGFPGHFLVGVRDEPTLYVDAFSGEAISEQGCRDRLFEMGAGKVVFQPSMLAATSKREILLRVLRNLKQIHIQASDYAEAIACIDRILLLAPEFATELRDRGILYRSLECWSSARQDLETFIAMAPNGPEVESVRHILEELKVRTAHIH
ncbi:MAG: regulator of sirC expression with transglutaminase-like and TPR domain [Myxococcota bacterium]|jgi:regulator of sirC expression with transglutaminase-like and TPR domain